MALALGHECGEVMVVKAGSERWEDGKENSMMGNSYFTAVV